MNLNSLLNSDGVQSILNAVNTIIKIIRWVVPIGLIVMTSIDIFKKMINPDDKDGQRKIMNRVIAAVVIFFLPTIINILMKLVNIGIDKDNSSNNSSQNNTQQNNNTNSNKPTETNSSKKVHILDCPSDDKVFDKGDKIILNAEGTNISWEMYLGKEYLNITSSSDGKIANIEVMDYYSGGDVTVIAQTNGSSEMCKINIRNKERTEGDVLINGCPKNKIKIGDTFTLTTNEDVKWYDTIYDRYYEIISVTSKSITIKVKDHYFNDILPVNIKVENNNNQIGYCYFYTH